LRLRLPTPGLVGSPHVHSSCLGPVGFAGLLIKCHHFTVMSWAFAQFRPNVALRGRMCAVLGYPRPWGCQASSPVIVAFFALRSHPTSCIPWPSCAVRASSPLGWWPLFCVLLLLYVCGHFPPAAYRGLLAPYGHGHPLPRGGVPRSASCCFFMHAVAARQLHRASASFLLSSPSVYYNLQPLSFMTPIPRAA
jgi:hypothetical protein